VLRNSTLATAVDVSDVKHYWQLCGWYVLLLLLLIRS